MFHPGHPVFHEGSKGWTCCKRRVLEFDDFMRMKGCVTKERHKFVGSGKKSGKGAGGGEERVETVKFVFPVSYPRFQFWGHPWLVLGEGEMEE